MHSLAPHRGVTTAVDLAGQPDALGHIQARIESGDLPGPRIVASMGRDHQLAGTARGTGGNDH